MRYALSARELNGEVPLNRFLPAVLGRWATYMLEGGSSKTFSKIKKIMYSEPEVIHILLDKLAQSVILYLNAQIAAGAQAVMIF